MSKLTGCPTIFHKIAKLFGKCVSGVTGAFSHNNRISIYTFSHEKLYSAQSEVRADLL